MKRPWMFGLLTILVAPLIAVAGCPDDEGGCPFEEPATFASLDELECGLGPDGPVYCHWTLVFDNGHFNWKHSDVIEEGPYYCDGDEIAGTTSGDSYYGLWDEAAGLLTWEGADYEVE